jgi:hypothetical protein
MISYQILIKTEPDGVTIHAKGDGVAESRLEHLYGSGIAQGLKILIEEIKTKIEGMTGVTAKMSHGEAARAESAARASEMPAEAMARALRDILGVFATGDFVITAERREAWAAALYGWESTVGHHKTEAKPDEGEEWKGGAQ